MSILVLDNYDSFTYNLVHYVKSITDEPVEVFRNDEITVDEVGRFDKIIISPGPGLPKDAGIIEEVIRTYGKAKRILGVCLGHQAIAEVFGGSLINLEEVHHGVSTSATVKCKDELMFKGLPEQLEVGRYHSWVVDPATLPEDLEVTSEDDQGVIMSMRHKSLDIKGIQFHPESVLTPHGMEIIRNWINN